MLIQFIYRLPDSLVSLMKDTIVDFNSNHITGWMDQMDANQIKHCSLFMICELETNDKLNILRNPMAVVAKNDSQAVQIFSKVTNKTNGTVMCEITRDCTTIKVEPTGKTI